MQQKTWMNGRYGWDRYNMTLLMAALLPSTLPYGYLATTPVLIYILFRFLSKNVQKRRLELTKHDVILMRFVMWMRPFFLILFSLFSGTYRKLREWGTRIKDRKTHVFPKCPSCGRRLRLPKGKGLLEASCPACGKVFRRMT